MRLYGFSHLRIENVCEDIKFNPKPKLMLPNLESECNRSYFERSYGFKAKMIYELISIRIKRIVNGKGCIEFCQPNMRMKNLLIP